MTLDCRQKAHAERAHAKKRAMERYGLDYNRQTRFKLLSIIDSGHVCIRARQSARVDIILLRYEGKPYRIAFDNKRHEIISFLPLNEVASEV